MLLSAISLEDRLSLDDRRFFGAAFLLAFAVDVVGRLLLPPLRLLLLAAVLTRGVVLLPAVERLDRGCGVLEREVRTSALGKSPDEGRCFTRSIDRLGAAAHRPGLLHRFDLRLRSLSTPSFFQSCDDWVLVTPIDASSL